MCLICVEVAKEKLTPIEAFRNMCEVWEHLEKEEHLGEVYGKILDYEKEVKAREVNEVITELKEEDEEKNEEDDAA